MASRPIDFRQLALLLLPLGLAACGPAEPPPPTPIPAPPPAPPAPVPGGDWRDWPLMPGMWRYVPGMPVSSAIYGEPSATRFIIRCDAATRHVTIMRTGTAADMAITTSTRTAHLAAGHIDENGVAMSGVILNASDALLDEIAFSRGRIAVEGSGLPSLAIPAWAEPARVIEDCRK